MDYDTFNDDQKYKTLPYIIDAMNAMKKKDKDRLASFLYRVNQCAKQIDTVRTVTEFLVSVNSKNTINLDYIYQIAVADYKRKLDNFFDTKNYYDEDTASITSIPSPYTEKLKTHVYNYVITRFKVAAGNSNA